MIIILILDIFCYVSCNLDRNEIDTNIMLKCLDYCIFIYLFISCLSLWNLSLLTDSSYSRFQLCWICVDLWCEWM